MSDSSIEHTIVHVEDEASQWQPLTSSLEVGIAEHLFQISPAALGSLNLVSPTASDFPSKTTISWRDGATSYLVTYWLVDTDGVESIAAQLKQKRDITFIIDALRPAKSAGLMQSSLSTTLTSIAPYLTNPQLQVRVFTAYSNADGVEFPPDCPQKFKKGVETHLLLDYLLRRIGFGGG